MKIKKILIIILGSVLAWLQFFSLSFGGQLRLNPNGDDLKGSYLPTAKAVYQSGAMVSTFNPDGATNYPNEIYLPNEQAPGQYRIHSNYSKNTDACAACHATHTAVGPSLLQWSSTYEACLACHDGTVSTTYNVQTGEIANTTSATYGGLFGTGKENFLSKHNVADGLEIGAAPGGTTTGVDLDGDTVSDQWAVEFGCQSCHSPHGFGGNARILNPDPNGVALANRQTKVRATSLDSVTFSVYPGATGLLEGDTNKKPYYILKGYRYDTWLAVYDQNGGSDHLLLQDQYNLNNDLGYTRIIFNLGYNPTPPVSISFVYAIKVDMTIGNYLENDETVDYRSGTVAFCEACHNDYSQPSGTGVYVESYRHAVNVDVADAASKANLKFEYNKDSGQYDMLVCLTCHLAHGTDQEYWINNLSGEGYGVDTAYESTGSSALKRKPNTAVCITCHQENSGDLIANQSIEPAGFSLSGGGYIGSAQCQTCHKKHYSGWQDTLHSKMVRNNDSINLNAKDSGTSTGWINNQSLRRNDNNNAVSPSGVILVLGSKWKQTYLVGDSTNGYKFLSYQWNVPGRTWEPFGLKADWDKYCIACHSTGYKVISKDANDTVTQWSYQEFGIGCEACHGEGGNHKANPSGDNIWNPAKANMTEQTRACGYCHMGGNSKNYKAEIDSGVFELRPDIPYPVGQTHKPWVDWQVYGDVPGYNKNFSDYSGSDPDDLFYSSVNGIFDEKQNHQQYQGFLQSKHMTSGVITCSTCHSSHGRNSSKEQLNQTSAQICASCHGTVMSIDTDMPEIAKTIQNVYVRSHTFRKPHRDVPSGAITSISNP